MKINSQITFLLFTTLVCVANTFVLADDLTKKRNQLIALRNCAANAQICHELEITDSQRKKLVKILESFEDSQRKALLNMKRFPLITNQTSKTEVARIAKSARAVAFSQVKESFLDVDKVLLPHQIKRLKQLSTQHVLRTHGTYNGFVGILESPIYFQDKLKLDDAEKSKANKHLEEIRREYEKELIALKNKYFKKSLEKLSNDQKKKIKSELGDLFDFEKSERAAKEKRLKMFREKIRQRVHGTKKND